MFKAVQDAILASSSVEISYASLCGMMKVPMVGTIHPDHHMRMAHGGSYLTTHLFSMMQAFQVVVSEISAFDGIICFAHALQQQCMRISSSKTTNSAVAFDQFARGNFLKGGIPQNAIRSKGSPLKNPSRKGSIYNCKIWSGQQSIFRTLVSVGQWTVYSSSPFGKEAYLDMPPLRPNPLAIFYCSDQLYVINALQ